MTYGWMGRSPDYKASFLATLGANTEFYDAVPGERPRWYRDAQERVPVLQPRHHPPAGRP